MPGEEVAAHGGGTWAAVAFKWFLGVAAVFGVTILVVGGAALMAQGVPAVQESSPPKRCGTSDTGTVRPLIAPATSNEILATTTEDLQGFASRYNEIRVANCLPAIPLGNFRRSACIEQRLVWIAEDPSEDPLSAWGHDGTERSDGKPPVGCDANLAGGRENTGALGAQKWWF